MSSPIITWEVDGWTGYQGHNAIPDANGVRWRVQDVQGWWGPVGVINNDLSKTGADGAYYEPPDRPARVVTISGTADCPGVGAMELAMDQFNALLSDRRQLHTLTAGELTRTRQADVHLGDGTAIEPTFGDELDFALTVIAPDPLRYSAELHQASCHLASTAPGGVRWNGLSGGGVRWNGPAGNTGVRWQSGSGDPGVMVLRNQGTADAPIRFTVAGPVPGPSMVDIGTDRTITYPGTVAAGSDLVVDTGTGYVALDGANRRPQLTRADFFLIPKGGQLTVAFRSTAPSPDALLIAQWRDAWL